MKFNLTVTVIARRSYAVDTKDYDDKSVAEVIADFKQSTEEEPFLFLDSEETKLDVLVDA